MARSGGCLKIVVVLFLVPTILGVGWWLASNVERVLTHEAIEAVVVDLIPRTDSDGDTVYAPVYEYEVAGQTYRYESQVGLGGIIVPDLGSRRTLLYDPDNPGDARVRNWFFLLILPGLLVVVPLLVLVALGWSTVRRRKRNADWPGTATVPSWNQLQEIGSNRRSIEATFMGTEPSQMDAAGKIRYRVKASAEIDDVVHRFVGEWVDDDPTLMFMDRGNKVEVRIDPDNPAIHEVVMPEPD
jgi:hypothetical protein